MNKLSINQLIAGQKKETSSAEKKKKASLDWKTEAEKLGIACYLINHTMPDGTLDTKSVEIWVAYKGVVCKSRYDNMDTTPHDGHTVCWRINDNGEKIGLETKVGFKSFFNAVGVELTQHEIDVITAIRYGLSRSEEAKQLLVTAAATNKKTYAARVKAMEKAAKASAKKNYSASNLVEDLFNM